MSQFGFGSQIGSQRDALSGGSRSNYASEEADLTDGLIKQTESINIPNTNQFYENIKFLCERNEELEKAAKSLGKDIKAMPEQKGLMAPPQPQEEEVA